MFAKLEGESAVIMIGGVYKVADLYERDGKLFAAASGGFVRLYANGSTSKPNMQIETIAIDEALYKDRFGRLCVAPAEGRKALTGEESEPLLLSKD